MLSLYVMTLGEAGVRCDSEALHLKWEDVELEEGFLWISSGRDGHRTKSGKGRWVPMTPRLRQAMREHFAGYRFASYDGRRTPWVFHHATTRRRAKAGDRIRVLRRAFEGAVERAKVPAELHQHDLRHRRVTTWLAAGGDAVKVKEAMGHADLRTTMDYTHLVRDNLRSLVETPRAGISKAVQYPTSRGGVDRLDSRYSEVLTKAGVLFGGVTHITDLLIVGMYLNNYGALLIARQLLRCSPSAKPWWQQGEIPRQRRSPVGRPHGQGRWIRT